MELKTVTDREADEWIANMDAETIRSIVQEWHALKQGLCYQVLLVPTGADDWVERSIIRARLLRDNEAALRKLMCELESAMITARQTAREHTCSNCSGTGGVGENSCCVCRGTGRRVYT